MSLPPLLFIHYSQNHSPFSGAIQSAQQFHCSPARALDSKQLFTTTYWQWQHRYLLDCIRQYGYPHLFVTISPYEWSMPKVCILMVISSFACIVLPYNVFHTKSFSCLYYPKLFILTGALVVKHYGATRSHYHRSSHRRIYPYCSHVTTVGAWLYD